MPIKSKYSNEEIETVINELLAVVAKNNLNTDAALMCLGNAASHIINNHFDDKQKTIIAEKFAEALVASTR
ncbi:YejL family protein [Algicola sagamiensis]|uniref:DUF1414 domain-containing protein n=1 Tax=Algicola sagamiensis TaxID=163869 RepID=UPI0003670785|nr:DUF1414 domain-containing protein [Algicola sagamiensis]